MLRPGPARRQPAGIGTGDDVAEDVLTARLWRRIQRDFPDPEDARVVADMLRGFAHRHSRSRQNSERLMAAVVLFARGDLDRARRRVQVGDKDWRDLLCSAGLENADYPRILDEELG